MSGRGSGTGPPPGRDDGRTREERRPLMEPTFTVNSTPSSRETDYVQYYTLPFLRYVNLFRFIVLVDGITAFALYLWGVDNEQILDGIIHFNIVHSTFDIAIISLVKMFLLLILISLLEFFTVHILEHPFQPSVMRHKLAVHISCIFSTSLAFIYATCKAGVVINEVVNHSDYTPMPTTQNVLTGFAAAFYLLEMIMAIYSFRAMRNLALIRVLRRVNDHGQDVDEEGKVIKKKADLKRLLLLVVPEWPLITVGLVGLIVSNVSAIAAPFFFGKVVDAAQESMSALNKTVITLFLIYVVGAIFSWLRTWFFLLAGHRFVARLRCDLFQNITDQEIAFFDVNRTGELTNRLASDTQMLQDVVTDKLSMVIRYFFQILGSLAFMFYLNASLTGILLAVVPIVSIGARKYGGFVRNLNAKFQDCLADSGATAEESISSLRTVRSFAGEQKALEQYSKAINESYNVGKKLAFAQGTFSGGIGIVAYGTVTIVLWYGGKLVNEKVLSPGVLTSFLLYTLQVAMAFAFVSGLYGSFMQAVGASVRVFELLDRRTHVRNQGGEVPDKMDGVIEFNDVVFIYPARPDNKVLKGISFTVDKGQMVALVGPSGGGKSTIVSLIERFYDPISGEIYIDGNPLERLDPSWVRKRISIVSQEPTLFACSIRDNISFGRDATHDEVVLAAQQSNAHNFIMSFEEGYDTLVGERGVRLSGGQKQRIAIARALIMNPAVLLLDEATSALDAESEHLVQEAIDRAMENRTVLVIAHRLSTVRNADKVMVVDHGQIAEIGTHNELISLDGVYKRLVLRQLMTGGSDLNSSSVSNDKEESGESRRNDNGGSNRGHPINGQVNSKSKQPSNVATESGESTGFQIGDGIIEPNPGNNETNNTLPSNGETECQVSQETDPEKDTSIYFSTSG